MKFIFIFTIHLSVSLLHANTDYQRVLSGNISFSTEELSNWKVQSKNDVAIPEHANHKNHLHAKLFLSANKELFESHLFYAMNRFIAQKFSEANQAFSKAHSLAPKDKVRMFKNFYSWSLLHEAVHIIEKNPKKGKSLYDTLNKFNPGFAQQQISKEKLNAFFEN